MPLKAKKIDWRKGNGSLIFGTAIMLITLCIVMMFVQTFIIRQNARDTQLAADSIADGTAVYMANEGGDYDDAVDQAEKIQKMVNEYTGVNTGNTVTIDQTLLEEESQVQATVTSQNRYLSGSGYVSEAFNGNSYGITRSATTEFSGYGANGDIVNWMIAVANDDSHGYCQNITKLDNGTITKGRTFNPDVDCSSFVYYALLNNGYTKEQIGSTPFTTHTMGSVLEKNGANIIPYKFSVLQPGDILWKIGHTEVYIGDGKTVGAHIAETKTVNGMPGDQTGNEVSIAPVSNHTWIYIYRLK